MKIETEHNICDRVWIEPLKQEARVQSIYISECGGIQYSCRWIASNESKTAYFYEDEVTKPPTPQAPGFTPPPQGKP